MHKINNSTPWIEKYRPQSLSEVISHETIVNTLENAINKNNLQHILFHGPPGSGKCLHPDTPLLLHNKTIKTAKEIKINDQLMGDDYKPRNVLSICSGNDVMYGVRQSKGDHYIVNSEHILCLIDINDIYNKFDNYNQNNFYNYDFIKYNDVKKFILEISVTEYLKLNDDIKKSLKGFKSFNKNNHDNDNHNYNDNDIGNEDDDIQIYLYDIKIFEWSKCHQYNGFEIDGNGRFLLSDKTVTHNTSVALACAKKLYGNKIDLMTLIINASEDRGIDVIRTKVQQFVTTKNIFSDDNVFKLVILDEADSMTWDAQAMLRKVIENFSKTTRFCLICNYVKKISQALQSRCARYRFPPLKPIFIKQKLFSIAQSEQIEVTEDGIDSIVKISKGDLRKSINILQATSLSYDLINYKNVIKCIGYVDNDDISKIFYSLINDDFNTSHKIITEIKTSQSYSLLDIINELSDILIKYCCKDLNNNNDMINIKLNLNQNIDTYVALNILSSLAVIEYNLSCTVNDDIQTCALISIFKSHIKKNNFELKLII